MALAAQIFRKAPEGDDRFIYALFISFILHLFIFWFVRLPQTIKHPEERLIEVTLQPTIEGKKKGEVITPELKTQMVSPSDLKESLIPPASTHLLSDKNTRTDKEQIKRGDGAPKKSEHLTESKSAPGKPTSTDQQAKDGAIEDRQINLKLDPFSLDKLTKPTTEKDEVTAIKNLNQYQPFSRDTSGNSDLFRFQPGSPDFLPNIPDGEMTLLNAKADRFAPFVRRVASQVFGIVRKLQWHSLPKSDVVRITDFTTVEAILSPEGKLIDVKFHESSGSSSFDKLITESIRQGASDQHPPTGVLAEDGKIHFIFKSRCWTRPGPAGIPDARWLLLSTGLL